LFGQRRLLPEYKASDVKLALILVRLANPAEEFGDEEESWSGKESQLSRWQADARSRFAASHWLGIAVRSGKAISPISRQSAKMHYGVDRNSVTSLVPAIV